MEERAKANRKLWATIRQLGQQLGDADAAEQIARDLAAQRFGAAHISKMTELQLDRLTLILLARLGDTPVAPRPRRTPKGVAGLITPRQRAFLTRLYADLNWPPERQQGFCGRIIARPQPITMRDAANVIQALLALKRHGGYDYHGNSH